MPTADVGRWLSPVEDDAGDEALLQALKTAGQRFVYAGDSPLALKSDRFELRVLHWHPLTYASIAATTIGK